jgi:hypothetical protein
LIACGDATAILSAKDHPPEINAVESKRAAGHENPAHCAADVTRILHIVFHTIL